MNRIGISNFAKGKKLNRWTTWGDALLATFAAGCESMSGRGWVPQGPGDYQDSRPPPRAEAPKAAPAAPRPTSPAATQPPVTTAQAPHAPAAGPAPASSPGAYTQATRYGDLLFISGQIALDLNTNELKGSTVEEQTRQVMEN